MVSCGTTLSRLLNGFGSNRYSKIAYAKDMRKDFWRVDGRKRVGTMTRLALILAISSGPMPRAHSTTLPSKVADLSSSTPTDIPQENSILTAPCAQQTIAKALAALRLRFSNVALTHSLVTDEHKLDVYWRPQVPDNIMTHSASLLLAQDLGTRRSAVAPSGLTRRECASVRDFGAVGDGSHDDTENLQAAIDSGNKCLHLSQGRYKVTSTLTFGIGFRSALFIGDGGWQNQYGAASAIFWAGPVNGTVILMTSVQNSRFQDFHIDGGGIAGHGLILTAKNTVGSSHRDIFDGVTVSGVDGSPGIAIHIDGNYYSFQNLKNQDVCCSAFRNISVYAGFANKPSNVKTGIRQDGTQSVHHEFDNAQITGYSREGMHFEQGDVRLRHTLFSTASPTATNDVYIGNSVDWVTIYDSYHEVTAGDPSNRHAYDFPEGARNYSTLLSGVRVRWAIPGGRPLYYKQSGPLTILAGSWDGGYNGEIFIDNAGHAPAEVIGVYRMPPITLRITGKSSGLSQ